MTFFRAKSLLEMVLVVNENIFRKTQSVVASIGVKLYFCNVPEVLYYVTIEEWKGFVCVFGNHS